MVNDIVNGITKAIYNEYGTSCKIYTESIEQGFTEPCFFVAVLESDQTRIVGNRYQRNISLDVHYFPAQKAKNKEMQEVAQVLYGILERVALLDGTMINGFQMHDQAVDDVLHFFVTYKPIVMYEMAEEPHMEEVATTAKVVE